MNCSRLSLFLGLGLGLLAQTPPPPPAPAPTKSSDLYSRRVRVGWGVQVEKLVRWVPADGRGLGQATGVARLRILISKKGAVESVEVLSGEAKIAKAVAAAVRKWEFQPFCLSVDCVPVETIAEISFPTRGVHIQWSQQMKRLRRCVNADPLGVPAGVVRLRILISRAGTVESTEVISGDAKAAQVVAAAVRQWEFEPRYLDARVETVADIPFPTAMTCGRPL